MNKLQGIEMQIQDLVVYGLGIFCIFVLGIVITAIIWNVVNKRFKPKPIPNRREDNQNGDKHWTIKLVSGIDVLTEKTNNLHGEMRDLNKFLRNGFSNDVRDIKHAISDCKERSSSRK